MPFHPRTKARTAVCAAACAAILLSSSCTIVKRGETDSAPSTAAQKAAGTKDFDAKSFVIGLWPKIAAEAAASPADLRELVAAIRRDPAAAELAYGRRKEDTAPYNYIAKGVALVLSVNTESAAGYAEIDVPDISGAANARIQLGPVIKSTALRDAMPFITFGDFVNQVDFANTAREINFYVRDTVVSRVDKVALAGKKISFVGAFTQDPAGAVLITPVSLEVED